MTQEVAHKKPKSNYPIIGKYQNDHPAEFNRKPEKDPATSRGYKYTGKQTDNTPNNPKTWPITSIIGINNDFDKRKYI